MSQLALAGLIMFFSGFQVENLTIVDESHELQFEDDDEEQAQSHVLPDYACKYCGLHDPVKNHIKILLVRPVFACGDTLKIWEGYQLIV